MKYKTYLFDLDGTLTDSGRGIINAVRYSLKRFGDEIPEEETLLKFIGPPLWESFETFLGFSREKAENAVKLYREYYNETGLFENSVYSGIPELLEALRSDGAKLAVATSKPEVFSLKILERFDLLKYFDSVTGSELDGTRTEKSDVIACALEKFTARGKSPEEIKSGAVMVGDRKHDIIGARKNGLPCIAVLYGYGDETEFREYGADYIVKTPQDITDI